MKQFLMLFRPMLAVELSAFNFGHIILAGQVLDFIYSRVPNNRPPPLIVKFSIFFHPGSLFQPPPQPPPYY